MEACLFCKIVADEVPSEKIRHESEKVVSVLDIHPVRPGHTLIIPEAHYQWFWQMPDDLANDVFKIARQVAEKLKQEYASDYVELSIVGKDIPHVHVHLIPRMCNDAKALP
ncbi:MAG: HIT domain-containing protein [Minisyncoccia bacterium]